ncbi:MAG: hypothetical protein ACETVN_00725, partial [Asgard group archaeon]
MPQLFGKLFKDDEIFSGQKECDKELLNLEYDNPFPGRPAVATPDSPPIRLIGRDDDKKFILDSIQKVAKYGNPGLILVQGETGIGKSALLSTIKNEIVNEKNPELQEYFIPIVYLESFGSPEDFNFLNFYNRIMGELDEERVLEKVAYSTLTKIISEILKYCKKTAFLNELGINNKELDKILKNPEVLQNYLTEYKKAEKFFTTIYNYFNFYYIRLEKNLPLRDNNYLYTFWLAYTATKNMLPARNALLGRIPWPYLRIETEGQARKRLEDLLKVLKWVYENYTLTIIFDQLEELYSSIKPEKISLKIFTLLLTLRQMKNISIILVGNLAAYKSLYDPLAGDMQTQLDQWCIHHNLTRLTPNEMTSIVHSHMLQFWQTKKKNPNPKHTMYPFGEICVEFLYREKNLNVRETLIALYDHVEKYREQQKIVPILEIADAIKHFKLTEDPITLNDISEKHFARWLIKKPEVKDRSLEVEKALCDAFNILQNEHPEITKVLHSPPLGEKEEKADIYVEFFGQNARETIKRLGIEVKIYDAKQKEVPKDQVEKTLYLLREGLLDYCTWVTTKELNMKARDSLQTEFVKRHGRTAPLTEKERAYLAWLLNFEKTYDRKPTPQETQELLFKSGINIIELKETLSKLEP